jgi:hypothetical protein
MLGVRISGEETNFVNFIANGSKFQKSQIGSKTLTEIAIHFEKKSHLNKHRI